MGRWISPENEPPILLFYVYVGDCDFEECANRYKIFKSHIEMAIMAVIYGDSVLFDNNPELINSSIYVKFDSVVPAFDSYNTMVC